MKKALLTICLSICILHANAQKLSVGYFPFQNTLSLTSNPEKLFWIDGRIETNTFFANINPEIAGMINIKRKQFVNIYTGLSFKMSFVDGFIGEKYIGGYSLFLGSRIKPIEKVPKLNFIFEISPYVNKYFDDGLLRAFLGISYIL